MSNPWAQALVHSLIATFVTCTPLESYQTLRPRQTGEGVVTGISWRDDNGTPSTKFGYKGTDLYRQCAGAP
jgi:hypothetical protein